MPLNDDEISQLQRRINETRRRNAEIPERIRNIRYYRDRFCGVQGNQEREEACIENACVPYFSSGKSTLYDDEEKTQLKTKTNTALGNFMPSILQGQLRNLDLRTHCFSYSCHLIRHDNAIPLANQGFYLLRTNELPPQIWLTIVHPSPNDYPQIKNFGARPNESFNVTLAARNQQQTKISELLEALPWSELTAQDSVSIQHLDKKLELWFASLSQHNTTEFRVSDIFWDVDITKKFSHFLSHQIGTEQKTRFKDIRPALVCEKTNWASTVSFFANSLSVVRELNWGKDSITYRHNTGIKPDENNHTIERTDVPDILAAIATQFTHEYITEMDAIVKNACADPRTGRSLR